MSKFKMFIISLLLWSLVSTTVVSSDADDDDDDDDDDDEDTNKLNFNSNHSQINFLLSNKLSQLKSNCDNGCEERSFLSSELSSRKVFPNHHHHHHHQSSTSKNFTSHDLTNFSSNEPDYFTIMLAIEQSIAKAKNLLKLKESISESSLIRNTSTGVIEWNNDTSVGGGGVPKSRTKRNEESVCYRNFGCFRYEGPFYYLDTLPASPESISTTFTLYTRKNPTEGQILDYDNNDTLVMSNFNASHDVKIIIHGFGSSSRRPWVLKMTEALLYLDDFNVINVDWENGSRLPNYVQAAANTQLIGKQIAKLIRMINFVTNLQPNRYHLIGFSLGAHVAGFTGMEIANISRITGLDPASPLFEGYPPQLRLDPSDAHFVDVIHSNGDSFIRGGLGSYTPLGHVDFYPNGGRVQVGCNSVLMGALTDLIYGKWNSLCNHRRAFRFFIDSVVRNCTFRAFACDSYEQYIRGDCFSCGADGTACSNMGYFAHQSKGRGNMYLVTRDKEPFCVNQFRVRIESSNEDQGVTWGRVELQLINVDSRSEQFVLTQETDELKEGGIIQALIVAHPAITNVTAVLLTYTRFKGWIYFGKNDWKIDRIEMTDNNGNVKSYCNRGTTISTTVTLRFELHPGNCSLSTHQHSNSVSIVGTVPTVTTTTTTTAVDATGTSGSVSSTLSSTVPSPFTSMETFNSFHTNSGVTVPLSSVSSPFMSPKQQQQASPPPPQRSSYRPVYPVYSGDIPSVSYHSYPVSQYGVTNSPGASASTSNIGTVRMFGENDLINSYRMRDSGVRSLANSVQHRTPNALTDGTTNSVYQSAPSSKSLNSVLKMFWQMVSNLNIYDQNDDNSGNSGKHWYNHSDQSGGQVDSEEIPSHNQLVQSTSSISVPLFEEIGVTGQYETDHNTNTVRIGDENTSENNRYFQMETTTSSSVSITMDMSSTTTTTTTTTAMKVDNGQESVRYDLVSPNHHYQYHPYSRDAKYRQTKRSSRQRSSMPWNESTAAVHPDSSVSQIYPISTISSSLSPSIVAQFGTNSGTKLPNFDSASTNVLPTSLDNRIVGKQSDPVSENRFSLTMMMTNGVPNLFGDLAKDNGIVSDTPTNVDTTQKPGKVAKFLRNKTNQLLWRFMWRSNGSFTGVAPQVHYPSVAHRGSNHVSPTPPEVKRTNIDHNSQLQTIGRKFFEPKNVLQQKPSSEHDPQSLNDHQKYHSTSSDHAYYVLMGVGKFTPPTLSNTNLFAPISSESNL